MLGLVGRNLSVAVKLLVAATLMGLLAHQVHQHEAVTTLLEGEKNAALLGLGVAVAAGAVMLSLVRWWLVAKAAGMPMSLFEALRYGTLGFALTFFGPGSVGGDLFKALALVRRREGCRAAAAATVLVDRALGLFAMLVTASVAIVACYAAGVDLGGFAGLLSRTTLVLTAVAALAVSTLLLLPAAADAALAVRVRRLPVVGYAGSQLLRSWSDYRSRPLTLMTAFGVSLLVDVLLVASFYCVAVGLPLVAPSFVEHFFIVPMNLIAASLPITPGGVGVREGVVDLLYQGFGVPPGQGTLIAAGHSLVMLIVGGAAIVYYLVERSGQRGLAAHAEPMPEHSPGALAENATTP